MRSEAQSSVKEKVGLPLKGKPNFLVVGRLIRTHGVHGDLLMEVLTDFPERLSKGSTVFVGENYLPQVIRSLRNHNDGLIIGFEAFITPESAAVVRDHYVFVPSEDRPPFPEGEYYHHQILGLHVQASENEVLGEIVQILQTGANDVLVLRRQDGTEVLIPYIPDVVVNVDLPNGVMVVNLLTGLLPE